MNKLNTLKEKKTNVEHEFGALYKEQLHYKSNRKSNDAHRIFLLSKNILD